MKNLRNGNSAEKRWTRWLQVTQHIPVDTAHLKCPSRPTLLSSQTAVYRRDWRCPHVNISPAKYNNALQC